MPSNPKATMKCGETRKSSRPGKKIMKLYCINGKKKLVHAGSTGVGTVPGPSPSRPRPCSIHILPTVRQQLFRRRAEKLQSEAQVRNSKARDGSPPRLHGALAKERQDHFESAGQEQRKVLIKKAMPA